VGNSRVLVTNLHNTTTEKELEELFSIHGRVRQVEIGNPKGGGSVEMFKKSEAKKAVAALDGSEFKCCKLEVQEARPLNDSRWKRNRRR
jgi:RNA recognition motif-containing protein